MKINKNMYGKYEGSYYKHKKSRLFEMLKTHALTRRIEVIVTHAFYLSHINILRNSIDFFKQGNFNKNQFLILKNCLFLITLKVSWIRKRLCNQKLRFFLHNNIDGLYICRIQIK